MKKFKFRLERVLQYRNLVKDDKKRELIVRNNKLYEDNQHLEVLQAESLMNAIQEQLELTAQQLYLIGLYGQRLEREIGEQEEVVAESQQAAEEALGEYVEAARDAEALVLLKKHKLNEYMDYYYKQEQKFLDELTTQRAKINSKQRSSEYD